MKVGIYKVPAWDQFFRQSNTPSFFKIKLYRLLTYNPKYSYDIFSTCIKGVFNYTWKMSS